MFVGFSSHPQKYSVVPSRAPEALREMLSPSDCGPLSFSSEVVLISSVGCCFLSQRGFCMARLAVFPPPFKYYLPLDILLPNRFSSLPLPGMRSALLLEEKSHCPPIDICSSARLFLPWQVSHFAIQSPHMSEIRLSPSAGMDVFFLSFRLKQSLRLNFSGKVAALSLSSSFTDGRQVFGVSLGPQNSDASTLNYADGFLPFDIE